MTIIIHNNNALFVMVSQVPPAQRWPPSSLPFKLLMILTALLLCNISFWSILYIPHLTSIFQERPAKCNIGYPLLSLFLGHQTGFFFLSCLIFDQQQKQLMSEPKVWSLTCLNNCSRVCVILITHAWLLNYFLLSGFLFK